MTTAMCHPVWVRAVALACALCVAQPADSDAPAAFAAFAPADNDLHPEDMDAGTPILVPASVAAVCRRVGETAFRQWEGPGGFDPADFFGPVVRLYAPENRELYVFEQVNPLGANFYHFILFDLESKTATAAPPSIYAKWMDGGDWGAPLEKPLVSFQDLDQDGHDELVVQERVHNGTMYNAVVYHYFRIEPDLSLNRVLALETRLLGIMGDDAGGVLERSLQYVSPLELILVAEIRREGSASVERVGDVLLRRPVATAPFAVAERHVLNESYASVLVTAADEDENSILAKGYRGYY